ncbi:MAG: hypothetical protein A3G81_22530 [Betaproteobacteria bacterium RIFCSPLOWO2_12_FULL_65_14]|nr:MAG: hypothetical protein A3G81_22530 [Betaproteobacteria bacterium RIFCSPLOWO2_12_FULL_65_14]
MNQAPQVEPSEKPAGRPLGKFLVAVGVSRATYYKLEPDCVPAGVRIGRKIIVTEDPAAWLARMAKRGSATTKRSKAAA